MSQSTIPGDGPAPGPRLYRDYMASRTDHSSANATAFEHTTAGGVALLQPDFVAETFEPGTETGGDVEALAVLDQLVQEPEMHRRYSGFYAYEFFVARRPTEGGEP